MFDISKLLRDNKKKTAKQLSQETLTRFRNWQAQNKARTEALSEITEQDAPEGGS